VATCSAERPVPHVIRTILHWTSLNRVVSQQGEPSSRALAVGPCWRRCELSRGGTGPLSPRQPVPERGEPLQAEEIAGPKCVRPNFILRLRNPFRPPLRLTSGSSLRARSPEFRSRECMDARRASAGENSLFARKSSVLSGSGGVAVLARSASRWQRGARHALPSRVSQTSRSRWQTSRPLRRPRFASVAPRNCPP
jgi:hypothetical protein